MIKIYKANTNVCINVVLTSKKNLHISFIPLSNGGSTFTTDNEEIMNAIESHYNFGKLFRLHSTQDESKKKVTNVVKLPEKKEKQKTDENPIQTENNGQNDETSTEETKTEPTLKRVNVSDLASAKDYLADTFGISRTALRSMKAITEQAAVYGIEFIGL
jgi:hypothetical protein|nr:MAG TPA: hypothetical protein [Caudoviricetes sp.]